MACTTARARPPTPAVPTVPRRLVLQRVECPWCTILTRRHVRSSGTTYVKCRQCGGGFLVAIDDDGTHVERYRAPIITNPTHPKG